LVDVSTPRNWPTAKYILVAILISPCEKGSEKESAAFVMTSANG